MEAIEQTWNGSELTNGRCTATISRNGDLVHRMYLEITEETGAFAVPNPGAHYIDNVELEIGGQKIDKHSGQWLETWAELTETNPTATVCTTAGAGTLFQKMSGMGGVPTALAGGQHIFVPLQFWFCRNPGLALPLIALQYHEVKVILNQLGTVISNGGDGGVSSSKLWCDYIYLDTDERRRFAQVSHEYLIEQVQEQSGQAQATNDLNFNHPVKELIWTGAWSLSLIHI